MLPVDHLQIGKRWISSWFLGIRKNLYVLRACHAYLCWYDKTTFRKITFRSSTSGKSDNTRNHSGMIKQNDYIKQLDLLRQLAILLACEYKNKAVDNVIATVVQITILNSSERTLSCRFLFCRRRFVSHPWYSNRKTLRLSKYKNPSICSSFPSLDLVTHLLRSKKRKRKCWKI